MKNSDRRRSGRPRRDPGRTRTAARVLTAAAAEFSKRGFAGANLETIAAAVGIRRPSLLHHFPTKESLYEAVVKETFSSLAGALAGAMSGAGEFPERLDAMVSAFTGFLDGHPAAASIILREFLDGDGPGRVIFQNEVSAVLDRVERFVVSEGGPLLRKGIPVRAAILQTASDSLLRAAAGNLRKPLWGSNDAERTLVRVLFLKD